MRISGKNVEFPEMRKRLKLREIINNAPAQERNVFILLARGANAKRLDKIEAILPLVKIEDVLAKVPEHKRHIRTRLSNIMRDYHIEYVRELQDVARDEFMKWRHAGETSTEVLAKAMAKLGFYFKGEKAIQ